MNYKPIFEPFGKSDGSCTDIQYQQTGQESKSRRLEDMLRRIYASTYIQLGRLIQMVREELNLDPLKSDIRKLSALAKVETTSYAQEEWFKEWVPKMVDMFEFPCSQLHLTVSCALIAKLKKEPPKSTQVIDIFVEAVDKEANERLLLFVLPERALHYENDNLLSLETVTAFPKPILEHVKEAGTCYALERPSACVYHLVGALDLAFKGIAKSLKTSLDIFDPHLDWGKIQTTINSAVASKIAKHPKAWGKKKPLYDEIELDIRSIKTVIRNPTSHFRKTYNDAEALQTFTVVKGFLEHYAKTL